MAVYVESSTGSVTYLAAIDLETGEALCDCPWSLYNKAMRVDNPHGCCRHVRALMERLNNEQTGCK